MDDECPNMLRCCTPLAAPAGALGIADGSVLSISGETAEWWEVELSRYGGLR
jgi:hypothetical protein